MKTANLIGVFLIPMSILAGVLIYLGVLFVLSILDYRKDRRMRARRERLQLAQARAMRAA